MEFQERSLFRIRRRFPRWNLEMTPGRSRLKSLSNSVYSDSKCLLATCGEDRKLKIWDVSRAGQAAAHSFDLVSTGSGLNFNSEDSKVTTGLQNGTIKLWDLESCKDFRVLAGHRAEVSFYYFGKRNDCGIQKGDLCGALWISQVELSGFCFDGDRYQNVGYKKEGRFADLWGAPGCCFLY